MIVDDEPNIRDGLKTLIDWEQYGFEVVTTAKNGEDGLNKYEQDQFDLIIVDIQMPKMDGLTMIDKIRKENEFIHFIILSGYAEFDYAKKAMQSEVEGYLLKPLDEDELIELLEQVKNKLTKEQGLRDFAQFEREKLKENFIEKLLSFQWKNIENEIVQFKEIFELSDASFQILLLKDIVDGSSRPPLNNWKDQLIGKFEMNELGLIFEKKNTLGILLINKKNDKKNSTSVYENIVGALGTKQFIVTSGEESSEIANMYYSYITASKLMAHHFYYEKKTIINKTDHDLLESTSINAYKEFNPGHFEQKLQYGFEIVDYQICKNIIDSFMDELNQRLFSSSKIKFYSIQFFSNALNNLMQNNQKYTSLITSILEKNVEIYRLHSLPEIKSHILHHSQVLIEEMDDGNADIPVKKIINLIHHRYNENLRLEMMAEIFNYSSAYLGKLFKNYTGEYFNTYLDLVRIEEAKKLLATGFKVYEVAEQVGYNNVDYFHKKFRQYVGVAPSKYRKQS